MAKARKRESRRHIVRDLTELESLYPAQDPAIPRQYSLVRVVFDKIPVEYHAKYPFTADGVYVFFGEIANMRGHCVVADHRTGQIYSGYHTENFEEITEDDV
jgi:hypothetical protein